MCDDSQCPSSWKTHRCDEKDEGSVGTTNICTTNFSLIKNVFLSSISRFFDTFSFTFLQFLNHTICEISASKTSQNDSNFVIYFIELCTYIIPTMFKPGKPQSLLIGYNKQFHTTAVRLIWGLPITAAGRLINRNEEKSTFVSQKLKSHLWGVCSSRCSGSAPDSWVKIDIQAIQYIITVTSLL